MVRGVLYAAGMYRRSPARVPTALLALASVLLGLAVAIGPAHAAGSVTERQQQLEQDARDDAEARALEEAQRRRDAQGGTPAVANEQRDTDAEQTGLNSAWDDAVDEAQGVHLDEVVSTRFVALVIGLAWLFLLWRRSRTRQRFTRRGGSGAGPG